MFEKPWDDPEAKLNKKIRKIGRSAAYSIGGGLGLWIISTLYPKEDGSEKIAAIIGDVSFLLITYGICILLPIIIQKKKFAPIVYLLMTWIIIPSWLVYLFAQAANS